MNHEKAWLESRLKQNDSRLRLISCYLDIDYEDLITGCFINPDLKPGEDVEWCVVSSIVKHILKNPEN